MTVQSMTNVKTSDYEAALGQIRALEDAGADLIRVSVPDAASAETLKSLVNAAHVPIIADIHYDFKLALRSIEAGAHKIRLNPMNLSSEGLREVARAAREAAVPIRVGVNQGSAGKRLSALELASAAVDAANLLEDAGAEELVLAVKSSDVRETVAAYRLLDKMTDHPLHIGLTEAGAPGYGGVKSVAAIAALLLDGIGDTIRVSLAGDPVQEVLLGRQILRAAGLDNNFAEVIACPGCARTEIDVSGLASSLERITAAVRSPMKIAVMGCTVNGIGESRNADFGVCGGRNNSAIFEGGKIIKTVVNGDILKTLKELAEEKAAENER